MKITPTRQDAASAFREYADTRTAGHEYNSVSILPDELCGYSGQKLMGVLADKPGSGDDYVDRIVHVWTNTGDHLIALQLQGPTGSKVSMRPSLSCWVISAFGWAERPAPPSRR
ncbi:hypothetical protein MAUB1S_01622 [Mycolicibacterium aubagnense]